MGISYFSAIYLLCVIGLSVVSLIAAVIVLYCHHHNAKRPLPEWIRFILGFRPKTEITPTEKVLITKDETDKVYDIGEKRDLAYSEMNETLNKILQVLENQNQMNNVKENKEEKFKDEWQHVAKTLDFCFFVIFLLVLFILNVWFVAVMMTA